MKKRMISMSLLFTFLPLFPADDNPQTVSASSEVQDRSFHLGPSLAEIIAKQEFPNGMIGNAASFDYYPGTESPYIAVSSNIHDQLDARDNTYVVHSMREFPGGVLLGLFESSDTKTLKTVQEEFGNSIDTAFLKNAYKESASKGWRQITKKVAEYARIFKNHQIKEENKALTRTDETCDQAFKEQWNRVPVAATIFLFVAGYKPGPKPYSVLERFEWEPEYESLSPGLIEPLCGGKHLKDPRKTKFIVTQGCKLSDRQQALIHKTKDLTKAIKCAGECISTGNMHSKYANSTIIGIDHELLEQSILERLPAKLKGEMIAQALEHYKQEHL